MLEIVKQWRAQLLCTALLFATVVATAEANEKEEPQEEVVVKAYALKDRERSDLAPVGLGGVFLIHEYDEINDVWHFVRISVEEVIDEHYQNQINQLGTDEKDLKKKIIKFREDELHHKDIAYDKGATKKGLYSIMDKIIKTGSKIAINISEKI